MNRVESLIEDLKSNNVEASNRAIWELVDIGKPAIPALVEVLNNPDIPEWIETCPGRVDNSNFNNRQFRIHYCRKSFFRQIRDHLIVGQADLAVRYKTYCQYAAAREPVFELPRRL